ERAQREEAEQRAREEEQRRRAAEASSGSAFPWILTGAGGVLLIGSAITGVVALGKVNNIENHCPMDRCEAGFDLDRARSSARTMVTVTDILWIAGATVAAGGLLLLVLGDDDGETEETPPPTATAMCGPDGCAASLRIGF